MSRKLSHFMMLGFALLYLTSVLKGQAVHDAENVVLTKQVKIPTATLAPGKYTVEVEDRMRDRAIIRIANQATGAHYLVLSVPNPRLRSANSDGLRFFPASGSGAETLQAWTDPETKTALELVYPKLEAVAITAESGTSAMAVDPSSDRLPDNLTLDDMKVVTLWLLSPKRITAGHHGEGIAAVKYSSENPVKPNAPLMASTAQKPNRLPKTASNLYLFFSAGLASLILAFALRTARRALA